MADEYDEGQGQKALICGVLAIFAHGCCCIPLVVYIAPFIIFTLEYMAISNGREAMALADAEGKSDPMALGGVIAGGFALLMSLSWIAMVVLSLAGVVGLFGLSFLAILLD